MLSICQVYVRFTSVQDKVDSESATLLINRLRYNNVLIGAAGPYGNILKIRPPLRFYRKDADFFIDAITKSLKEIGK